MMELYFHSSLHLHGVLLNQLSTGTTLLFYWGDFRRKVNALKNVVFWDVALCRSCVNRRFGGKYRLHLEGRVNVLFFLYSS
jgi:hypothetical protein